MKTTLKALFAVGLLLACALTGCTQDDVTSFRDASAALEPGDALPDGMFGADIVFCRRIGSKTGKRIEIDHEFRIRDGKKYRYVNALVDLDDVPVGEMHQVHLVWIRPDGKDMFRRFGTVELTATETGYTKDVVWLDAEDLHDITVEESVEIGSPGFTLGSRLNVRPEKERTPGTYSLRFYWNRELMLEESFELLAAE